MKKKMIAASLLMAVMGSAFAATAVSDGKIIFEGEFVDSGCDVMINGTKINAGSNAPVNLGKWNLKDFQTAGLLTPLMPVSVKLENCPTAEAVNIYFRGNTITDTIFALDAGSTATNVGVRLYTTADTTNVIAKEQTPLRITLKDGKGQGEFFGSYITVNGAAGAGKANSTIELTLSYS